MQSMGSCLTSIEPINSVLKKISIKADNEFI